MRSNIARTWFSGRVPLSGAAVGELMRRGQSPLGGRLAGGALALGHLLLERGDEVHELLELLRLVLAQRGVGGHRRVGFTSVRAIASRPSRSPISVRFGPSVLPFSPILWQPRQPDEAVTSLPSSYLDATVDLDLARRAGDRAEHREVGHRGDGGDGADHRDRALERVALRAAVVERQQEQQHQADRGDADRGEEHQLRRLDHAQQLEEEEEVPLGPRRVGRGGRVRLRAQLGAEEDRHQDDHDQRDRRHRAVLGDRVGEERLALALQDRVLAEVLLLLARVHAQISSLRSSFFSAFSHGGAVVPSLATR